MTAEVETHDPHFEPLISLPEHFVPKLEEDEDVLFKMRAKLFRWASEVDPAEWKERGTGDVKILRHKETSKIRLLMRRDKTYKICANHYLHETMKLVSNCGSDRAWVWNAFADYAEDEPSDELFAIRFLNAENANKFKETFDEHKVKNSKLVAKEKPGEEENESSSDAAEEDKLAKDQEDDKVIEKLEELTVKEKNTESADCNSEGNTEKTEEKVVEPPEDSPEK